MLVQWNINKGKILIDPINREMELHDVEIDWFDGIKKKKLSFDFSH